MAGPSGQAPLRSGRVFHMDTTGALVLTGASVAPGTHVHVRAKDLGQMGSLLLRASIDLCQSANTTNW